MRNNKRQMTNGKWFLLSTILCLITASSVFAQTPTQPPAQTPAPPDFQSVIARQASLVTEFDVNGLKVLVKRREGSQTVAVRTLHPRRRREHHGD